MDGSTYQRQARADQLVGSLYGRLLPNRLRNYLRRSTNPQTRAAVRHRLGNLVLTASKATRSRSSAALPAARRPDETVVRLRGRTAVAIRVDDLTPLAAKRHNLQLVRSSLDAAGVPYFLVRGSEAIRTRVAVPDSYRAATTQAIARTTYHNTFYVQRIQQHSQATVANARTIQHATGDNYFRLAQLLTEPTECLTLGTGYGCEIEFWREEGAELSAPRKNMCTDTVDAHQPLVQVRESALSQFSTPHHQSEPSYPSRAVFAASLYTDITFPIDVVYTWVDGEDPAWQQRRAAAAGTAYHPEAANSARFVSHDELRYSLRSVRTNMPWVRHIYLVTDQQVPRWLDQEQPGLTVIDHRDIFVEPDGLPTFNSHAIESQLHHILGLAEHFIYLNDDVCIGAPVTPDQFFHANGQTKFFPSRALIPFGHATADDIPSSAAGKNNRDLISREFGTTLTNKMKHVPHAVRTDVLAEIEKKFPEEHRRTAANRFRHHTDISVLSSLYHYYAFRTGRAVPGALRYSYLDLAASDTPKRLRSLLIRRDHHVLCLNDTTIDTGDGELQRNLLVPFLEAYFPRPSPHELPGH